MMTSTRDEGDTDENGNKIPPTPRPGPSFGGRTSFCGVPSESSFDDPVVASRVEQTQCPPVDNPHASPSLNLASSASLPSLSPPATLTQNQSPNSLARARMPTIAANGALVVVDQHQAASLMSPPSSLSPSSQPDGIKLENSRTYSEDSFSMIGTGCASDGSSVKAEYGVPMAVVNTESSPRPYYCCAFTQKRPNKRQQTHDDSIMWSETLKPSRRRRSIVTRIVLVAFVLTIIAIVVLAVLSLMRDDDQGQSVHGGNHGGDGVDGSSTQDDDDIFGGNDTTTIDNVTTTTTTAIPPVVVNETTTTTKEPFDGEEIFGGWDSGNNGTFLSGPLVGHTTSATAKIWAYAPNATVSVLYRRLIEGETTVEQLPFQTVKMETNQTTVELTGLNASTLYQYYVTVDGELRTKLGGSFRTTPLPQDGKHFRYVFGSCISFKRDPVQNVWDQVLKRDPEFLIINGDTVYSDSTNYTEIWGYHMTQRSIGPFANIIRRLPVYATWDDHDFANNDGDGLVEGKENSLRAFSNVFANPSYGTPSLPGIHTTWRRGDVQFFVVDNRYHRIGDLIYAGAEQMEWLKNGLKSSDAVFKIVVHGGTIRRVGRESWFERSTPERRELMDFLATEKITGVLFHGGDIHNNFFNPHPKCPVNGTLNYEVFELVSSGLTNGGGRFTVVDVDTRGNLPTLTYTMIEAGVEQEKGRLTILDGSFPGRVPGTIRHELLYRSPYFAVDEYKPCAQNISLSYAYPIVGGGGLS